jgi:glycerol-3-phosphate dehydrogenase
MNDETYDFIIVGAGITGTMIARELSRTVSRVLLLDRGADVGMGASSANSAIIHAGYDPRPGTLKAELNVKGNKLWDSVSSELDIPFKRTGSYVVAIGAAEFKILDSLYQRGISNGVPGLRIIQRNEFLTREPLINPLTSGALFAPSAGVIDPFRAVIAAAENAAVNGVRILIGTGLEDIIIKDSSIRGIKTNNGIFHTRWLINAAGLYALNIMRKAGSGGGLELKPRRGEYLIFDSSKFSINNVLFPIPTDKGKGVLVSTTVHGNVMIGPNSNEVDSPEDCGTTRNGLAEVIASAKKLVPSVSGSNIIAEFAGIRASGRYNHDFIIEIASNLKGMLNLAFIDSPGFASAPAIALKVMELLKDSGEKFIYKKNFKPGCIASPCFSKLSHREKAELVRKNPAYGRIVCRCEEVTEGEVIDAMRSPIGARTYDGIKRRTWLGTGRCQGSFDYPRVIGIIAQESGIPVTEVTKKGAGSRLVFRGTKER